MADLEQLQLLAQLTDDIEIAINKLEKSYKDNNAQEFQNSKKAILDFQKKISGVLSNKKEEFK